MAAFRSWGFFQRPVKRLEQENAGLRAELAEVKRALSRYAVLQEALAETGRLPR